MWEIYNHFLGVRIIRLRPFANTLVEINLTVLQTKFLNIWLSLKCIDTLYRMTGVPISENITLFSQESIGGVSSWTPTFLGKWAVSDSYWPNMNPLLISVLQFLMHLVRQILRSFDLIICVLDLKLQKSYNIQQRL